MRLAVSVLVAVAIVAFPRLVLPQTPAEFYRGKTVMPVAGNEIQKLIVELYATPADVVAKTTEMIK